MNWNYRVFENDFGEFEIRDVYYDEDNVIRAISEVRTAPYGIDLEDIAEDLKLMQKALDKPVLNHREVVSRWGNNDDTIR